LLSRCSVELQDKNEFQPHRRIYSRRKLIAPKSWPYNYPKAVSMKQEPRAQVSRSKTKTHIRISICKLELWFILRKFLANIFSEFGNNAGGIPILRAQVASNNVVVRVENANWLALPYKLQAIVSEKNKKGIQRISWPFTWYASVGSQL
jgi:hypothetical protein